MGVILMFSIYRFPDYSDVEVKFVMYKDKLPLLLNVCKDVSAHYIFI